MRGTTVLTAHKVPLGGKGMSDSADSRRSFVSRPAAVPRMPAFRQGYSTSQANTPSTGKGECHVPLPAKGTSFDQVALTYTHSDVVLTFLTTADPHP